MWKHYEISLLTIMALLWFTLLLLSLSLSFRPQIIDISVALPPMERNDHDYFPHLPLLVIMHQHLFPICQLHLPPRKDPLKCIFDISLSKNNTLSSSLRCIFWSCNSLKYHSQSSMTPATTFLLLSLITLKISKSLMPTCTHHRVALKTPTWQVQIEMNRIQKH